MSVVLKGKLAPAPIDREVKTPGAVVRFAHDVGARGWEATPGLIVEPRKFLEKDPQKITLSDAELAAIADTAQLERAVADFLKKNTAIFEAADITTSKNEQLGIAGLRKQRFFDGLKRKLTKTAIPASARSAARTALVRLERATYQNRDIQFDVVKHDTYHPYSDPFDRGVRLLAELAKEGVERGQIENLLAYVTDRKTVRGWGSVDERDGEVSLGLRAIDRGNGGQTLSLAKGSNNMLRPQYAVMNVGKTGLPQGQEQHAGKAVYRDGSTLYFDKTKTVVPAELVAHVVEKASSGNHGLRLLEQAERARSGFPYDWNGNGTVDIDPIDISWWGHCHIEAPLATLSLKATNSVCIYDAASGNEKVFDAAAVNHLLFAAFDNDRYASIDGGGRADPTKTDFVGSRNDTGGAPRFGDELALKLSSGKEMKFKVRLDAVYDAKDATKRLSIADVFQPTEIDQGIRFRKNPLFRGLHSSDWSSIDGNRKFELSVEFLEVADNGEVKRKRRDHTIDFAKPSPEPLLIGTELASSSYPPALVKYYLDEKTKTVESRRYEPKQNAAGKYEMVESGSPKKVGTIKDVTLGRELTRESIIGIHERMLRAAREGLPFVTEKTPGHAVWNYATAGLRVNEVQRDGNFVKYDATLNTQGGTMTFSYIIKEDAKGKAVDAHALSDPPDFLWQTLRQVSMPLFKDGTGIAYNAAAHERGALTTPDGQLTQEGVSFFRLMADVVYAALAEAGQTKRFAVRAANGALYLYDDEAKFRADVVALQNERGGVAQPAVA